MENHDSDFAAELKYGVDLSIVVCMILSNSNQIIMENNHPTLPESHSTIEALTKTLEENPEIWSVRKEAARLLFDNGEYAKAADLIWFSPEIPAVDLEIAFAARVVSRAQPKRAIRLLNHVQEKASGNPAKLLALANALMHYGMVMQAARFYGAATAIDKTLTNGDLEHFLLWLDDAQRLWGDWDKDEQKMDELPWVKRDQAKGEDFEKMMLGLTTPIVVPGLKKSGAEHLENDYYQQMPMRGAEVTAPPAVTVPLDQLNPADVIHDEKLGALPTQAQHSDASALSAPTPAVAPAPSVLPSVAKVPQVVLENGERSEEGDSPKKPKFLF